MKNSIFSKNFETRNYSLSKKLILLIFVVSTSILNTKAQNVNIPDANFKANLVGHTGINTNGDTEIQVSEASVFTGTIGCGGLGINNLTGIEAFTSLTALNCDANNLTSLDLSNNPDLQYLSCTHNALTALDLLNNTDIWHLSCHNNNLTSLEVSNVNALQELLCYSNALSTLDLSNNTALTSVYCSFNTLTNLDMSNGNNNSLLNFTATNNPNLTCIQVDDSTYSANNWTNIDATANFSESCGGSACTVNIPDANFKAYLVGNTAINTNGNTEIECSEASAFSGTINCGFLSISDLTGIEAFTALTELLCHSNNLTSLDVSNNVNLTQIYCPNNNTLSSLDVSNNTNLLYIACAHNSLSSLDVSNNTSLIELGCGNNSINSLDLSNNTSLTYLRCDYNNLSSLNVANGNNTSFSYFYAPYNPNLSCIQVDDATWSTTNWTYIDATASFSTNCGAPCTVNIPDANFKAYLVGNTAINTNGNTEIECSEASAFTGAIDCQGLNISDLTGIETFILLDELKCFSNNLTNIDISQNTSLTYLNCWSNQLSSLDITQNTNLNFLSCGANLLSALNISQNLLLTELYFPNNSLNTIDVTHLTSLEKFRCDFNNITTLDLSQNTILDYLECDHNNIVTLDLSSNPNLERIECNHNSLIDLNVASGGNTTVNIFNASNNPTLICIEVDDVAYSTANWTNIDPTASFSTNCGVVAPILVSSISVQGQNGVSTITTNGGTLQMEADVLPMNADDASYTWSVNNNNASISAIGLLTATANGTVEVTATANDGSGTIGTKTITISNQSVGIKDLSFENLNVYPNPSSGVIHIETNETLTNIKLMDLTGKNIKIFSAEDKTIDISEFDFGIYFLEVANEKYKSLVKIIKK